MAMKRLRLLLALMCLVVAAAACDINQSGTGHSKAGRYSNCTAGMVHWLNDTTRFQSYTDEVQGPCTMFGARLYVTTFGGNGLLTSWRYHPSNAARFFNAAGSAYSQHKICVTSDPNVNCGVGEN